MPSALSYDLHKLTARLDRAADVLLRHNEGVSYSRFLALFAVRESSGTQRDLARWLGLTEPSTSRMVAVLAGEGLLVVTTVPGAGNRRQLSLTSEGAEVVERCSVLLEQQFDQLVERSRVAPAAYRWSTRRLLDQLDIDEQHAQAPVAPAVAR